MQLTSGGSGCALRARHFIKSRLQLISVFYGPIADRTLMATRRVKITPGTRVAVPFTPSERRLVLEHTFAGLELTKLLQGPVAAGEKLTAHYTLDDIDELMGFVAAEANHATDKRLQKRLYALHERLDRKMQSYDDGSWPD